uniref:Uncharacterized protein n=1 Tax=Arundo donax TaxID=35708 RepID=A0A0A9FS58_ARUDO
MDNCWITRLGRRVGVFRNGVLNTIASLRLFKHRSLVLLS